MKPAEKRNFIIKCVFVFISYFFFCVPSCFDFISSFKAKRRQKIISNSWKNLGTIAVGVRWMGTRRRKRKRGTTKNKNNFFLISVSRSLAWVCGRNQNSKINSYTNWTALLSPLYISSADGRWRNKTVCDTDTQRMWLECLLCSSFSASCSIKLLWTFNERQNESTKKKRCEWERITSV